MINKNHNEQQMKAICSVLGNIKWGYSKTELRRLLQQIGIETVSDGSESNGVKYKIGLNKRD